jgi:hypothetical protein
VRLDIISDILLGRSDPQIRCQSPAYPGGQNLPNALGDCTEELRTEVSKNLLKVAVQEFVNSLGHGPPP